MREPLVRHRVPELVRMNVGQTGVSSTTTYDLSHPRVSHRPAQAEPQAVRALREGMPRSHPRVAVDGLGRLLPERARATPVALARHERDVQVEIDIGHSEPSQLGPPHPGVDEQAEDGRISPCLKVLALADSKETP